MGQRLPLLLNVGGPLDTANPPTNRSPGTLLEAIDTAHRWIGPRRGAKAYSWSGRLDSANLTRDVPGAYGFPIEGTGVVQGSLSAEQANLGLRWTVDIAFHAFATTAVSIGMPLLRWNGTSAGTPYSDSRVEIGVYGSTHATNPNKVYAIVRTTNAAGAVQNTYTLVGSAPLFSSGYVLNGEAVRCFVRLTREDDTLRLRTSRGDNVTQASVPLTQQSLTAGAGQDYVLGGEYPTGDALNGHLLKAMIRTGYPSSSDPLLAVEHVFPRAPDVKFFATGNYAGANSYNLDHSRYGAHGRVLTPGTYVTNDLRYPYAKRVQGMGSFSGVDANGYRAVCVGGLVLVGRAT